MKHKLGDIVFQTRNSVWSGPMKIIELRMDGYLAVCLHPKEGIGAFTIDGLTIITYNVAKKLNKLYGGKFDNKD